MEYYDYDPKYGQGDGGIERNISRLTQNLIIASKITGHVVDIVPYAGGNEPVARNTDKQTYPPESDWHNRPA